MLSGVKMWCLYVVYLLLLVNEHVDGKVLSKLILIY
jgi:hypothetical protein